MGICGVEAIDIFRNFWGQVGSMELNLRRDQGHGRCDGGPIPLKDQEQA